MLVVYLSRINKAIIRLLYQLCHCECQTVIARGLWPRGNPAISRAGKAARLFFHWIAASRLANIPRNDGIWNKS
jgi:hypothetical protein